MHEATLAGDGARLGRARAAMDHALRAQLEPTWALMWRAVDLLGALPAAAHAEQRWLSDRWSFTSQVAWIREGGAPQARRDGAVAAARRLARLEREQQRLAVERAYDDPLVMAEYRMTGEAFAGAVVEAEPDRLVALAASGPCSAPWSPWRPRRGALRAWRGAQVPGQARPAGDGHRTSCRRVRRELLRAALAATAGPGSSSSSRAAWAGR